jgi:hypothetical protein
VRLVEGIGNPPSKYQDPFVPANGDVQATGELIGEAVSPQLKLKLKGAFFINVLGVVKNVKP